MDTRHRLRQFRSAAAGYVHAAADTAADNTKPDESTDVSDNCYRWSAFIEMIFLRHLKRPKPTAEPSKSPTVFPTASPTYSPVSDDANCWRPKRISPCLSSMTIELLAYHIAIRQPRELLRLQHHHPCVLLATDRTFCVLHTRLPTQPNRRR